MPSTQSWSEFNSVGGTATETTNIAYMNWMNADLPDTTGTVYTTYPITAGNSSFTKYQAVYFSGTFDQLSALTFAASTTTPGTHVTLNGSMATTWSAPVATPNTVTGSLASPISSGFGTSSFTPGSSPTDGPFSSAGGSTTTTNPIYSNAFITQIQTTASQGPGDISSVTITAAWTES